MYALVAAFLLAASTLFPPVAIARMLLPAFLGTVFAGVATAVLHAAGARRADEDDAEDPRSADAPRDESVASLAREHAIVGTRAGECESPAAAEPSGRADE